MQEPAICRNCDKTFIIDEDDQSFYRKLGIPAPTWCPRCRMIRRQNFRNERTLYKINCALCGKGTLSMYGPDKPYTVYCVDCYASDQWDPSSYGRDYDFSRPFFEQFESMMRMVPRRALYQDFAVRSEYTNQSVYMKDSYLCFGGHHYEDSQYCAQNFYLNNCADVDFSMRSEFCYDSIHLRRCNEVYFSAYSEDCADSWFLYGCKNCSNCVGCTNLKNASHCIFNEQYSKEDYGKRLKEFDFQSRENVRKFREEFSRKTLNYPRKYAWVRNMMNSTGDDLEQVKECIYCFSATEDENCRYSFFVPTGAKDSYDIDHVGLGTENSCEVHSSFGCSRALFGNRIYYSHDVLYSDDCYNCGNLFGCVSLRKKDYCILNRQYSKEEYEKLIPKIIEHMNNVPYVAHIAGRESRIIYKFGEFFPISIMPFAYNESVAQEYFPLSKEEALKKGFQWRETDKRNYKITMPPESVPDRINEIKDNMLDEVVGCAHGGKCQDQCTTAFLPIAAEVQFYKKAGVPFPQLCPNCRHAERLKQMNPMGLHARSCQCAGEFSDNKIYKNTAQHFHGSASCGSNLESPFSSERPEFIYCEACYNSEVS